MCPIYRQITGTDYYISCFGVVLNKRFKQLKPEKHYKGYLKVGLSVKGVVKKHFIHRLVAKEWIKKPKGCDIVNHIDCDKTNNFVSNLEWTTISGNTKHAVENGLIDMNYVRSFKKL